MEYTAPVWHQCGTQACPVNNTHVLNEYKNDCSIEGKNIYTHTHTRMNINNTRNIDGRKISKILLTFLFNLPLRDRDKYTITDIHTYIHTYIHTERQTDKKPHTHTKTDKHNFEKLKVKKKL